ncbi:MAG: hypothetical protein QW331_00355 [Candidatus Woesearchaeota archaeon]
MEKGAIHEGESSEIIDLIYDQSGLFKRWYFEKNFWNLLGRGEGEFQFVLVDISNKETPQIKQIVDEFTNNSSYYCGFRFEPDLLGFIFKFEDLGDLEKILGKQREKGIFHSSPVTISKNFSPEEIYALAIRSLYLPHSNGNNTMH